MSREKRHIGSGTRQGTRAIYCREKDLPRLTGLWPSEIDAADINRRTRIVSILKNNLRLERQRGRSGHWCYDINRHLALKQALTSEQAELKKLLESRKRPLWIPSHRRTLPKEFPVVANGAAMARMAVSCHPALFLVLPTASSS